jgi:hypothetical protein
MSGTLADITNGQDGVVVENKLNAQILRYNESWRQIIALQTTGASKVISKTSYIASSVYLGGGVFNVGTIYDEDAAMSGNIWTVPTTGTYIFAWRDLKMAFGAGHQPTVGVEAGYILGIGLWIDNVFYRLEVHQFVTVSGTLASPIVAYSGMSCVNLTVGQPVQFGTATRFANHPTYLISNWNLHDQGGTVGYIDVYHAQTGLPA